jgi:hypothetical protein
MKCTLKHIHLRGRGNARTWRYRHVTLRFLLVTWSEVLTYCRRSAAAETDATCRRLYRGLLHRGPRTAVLIARDIVEGDLAVARHQQHGTGQPLSLNVRLQDFSGSFKTFGREPDVPRATGHREGLSERGRAVEKCGNGECGHGNGSLRNFDAAPFYRRPYQFLHHWNLQIPGSHDHAKLAALLDRRGNNQNAFCAAAAREFFARATDPDLSTFHTKTFQ